MCDIQYVCVIDCADLYSQINRTVKFFGCCAICLFFFLVCFFLVLPRTLYCVRLKSWHHDLLQQEPEHPSRKVAVQQWPRECQKETCWFQQPAIAFFRATKNHLYCFSLEVAFDRFLHFHPPPKGEKLDHFWRVFVRGVVITRFSCGAGCLHWDETPPDTQQQRGNKNPKSFGYRFWAGVEWNSFKVWTIFLILFGGGVFRGMVHMNAQYFDFTKESHLDFSGAPSGTYIKRKSILGVMYSKPNLHLYVHTLEGTFPDDVSRILRYNLHVHSCWYSNCDIPRWHSLLS